MAKVAVCMFKNSIETKATINAIGFFMFLPG